MCRFVYDKFLIDKKTGLYLGDKRDISDLMNGLEDENIKLKSVLRAILTGVSKDKHKCTLHIYVDDYDYFHDVMMEDISIEEENDEKEELNTGAIIKQNSNHSSYTFNMHPPCYYYDCNKCPYLEYPFCSYESKNKMI